MAAYAAVASVKASFKTCLHYGDAALSPEVLDICKRAYKESTLFLDYVERLSSRSRKRASGPLGRVVEAVDEYFEKFSDAVDSDAVVEHTPSLLDTLKKMHQECCSLLEDEEVVSSDMQY